jgi:hypothetical protein
MRVIEYMGMGCDMGPKALTAEDAEAGLLGASRRPSRTVRVKNALFDMGPAARFPLLLSGFSA